MCAKKKESAEQKLLKMIEASSGASVQPTKVEKVDKRKNIIALIRTVNMGLIVMVVFFLVLLGNEVIAGISLLKQRVAPTVDRTRSIPEFLESELINTIHDKSFYLAGIDDRNIFQPFVVPEKQVKHFASKNRKILQKTANLRLVGIAWLDTVDSASVMIEDTEKGKTYFLKKGQKIGDIIVKTIYADSAVLGYEDEEMTIRYEKSNPQKR